MATFFVTFPRRRRGPSRRDVAAAIERTIRQFPELLDYYIKLKEDTGDEAKAVSRDKVDEVKAIFVKQLQRAVEDIEQKSTFYEKSWTSYDEALERAREFKH